MLSNRETQVQAQLREMTSSVSLILALGGGWDPAQLPNRKNMLEKQHWSPGGEPLPQAPGTVAPANPPAVEPAPLNLPGQR